MDILIKNLSDILKDCKSKDQLSLTPEIVEKWINQFTEENRIIILKEMIHIFQHNYASEKDINIFLEELVEIQV